MPRAMRNLSKEFSAYQEYIVAHPNYASLPNKLNAKGVITWVKQGDSARAQWWDRLKSELNQIDRAGVARLIHPAELGGLKPCQVCGKSLSIKPVYPNQLGLRAINQSFTSLNVKPFEQDIASIAGQIESIFGPSGLVRLASLFQIQFEEEAITSEAVGAAICEKGRNLSPGVMSNAPDRLDGFHTYNACCRATQDTGRSPTNLARYSSDRRAYENWADGDWRAADRLMGAYKRERRRVACPRCGAIRKMSADHIGPISLGFRHSLHFQPMCTTCNSSKNNRLTFADFQHLLALEEDGSEVISWHSAPIWIRLKPKVESDDTALRASVLMRRNLHHVLVILSAINESGFSDFLLSYLHPEFAAFDFEFSAFDPSTGSFEISKRPVDSANTRRHAERYLRISFESLREYAQVENRNSKKWNSEDCDFLLTGILDNLNKGELEAAAQGIMTLLGKLADLALAEF